MFQLTPGSLEDLTVIWFYDSFPKGDIALAERCVRKAATIEEAKVVLRLLMTADWLRTNIRTRRDKANSIFAPSNMVDVDLKAIDWAAIAQSFWDRLRPRNHHYRYIHTYKLTRKISVLRDSMSIFLITTDDVKTVADLTKTYPFSMYTKQYDGDPVSSKDKIKEFDDAIERYKNVQLERNIDQFSYIVSIGCRRFECGQPRPYYEFENRR